VGIHSGEPFLHRAVRVQCANLAEGGVLAFESNWFVSGRPA
jgi:hypothetical protein